MVDRKRAIKLARGPHAQYVVMKAEVIVRVEETAVEIKQIEL